MTQHPVRIAWLTKSIGTFRSWRKNNAFGHKGFDYYVPRGTPVFSPGDGVVAGIGSNMDRDIGFGHNVTITLDNGWTALSAHMDRAPLVKKGQRVNAGTQLGVAGDTGNAWAVGVHVHHQLWISKSLVNENLRDPLKYHANLIPAGLDQIGIDNTMDLSKQNLIDILGAAVDVPGHGFRSIGDGIKATYFYGDYLAKAIEDLPNRILAAGIPHPIAKNADGTPLMVSLGAVLESEPLEHHNTRVFMQDALLKLQTGELTAEVLAEALDKLGLDKEEFARAAADEFDRREREALLARENEHPAQRAITSAPGSDETLPPTA